jgi:hypothetical protein
MNRNQDLVTFAVNSNAIIKVFILLVGGELDVDVFTDTRWDHPLLVIFNLEVWSCWWKDVKPLRSWRVVN